MKEGKFIKRIKERNTESEMEAVEKIQIKICCHQIKIQWSISETNFFFKILWNLNIKMNRSPKL